jgi:polyhydroxyalkanoate synthesis regulator phasin
MSASDADASRGGRDSRDLLERIVLAGFGAVALSAERLDALADALAKVGGVRRDEARAAVDDLAGRWRGDATRVTESAGRSLEKFFRDVGLVTRDEFDELELRVAQLEHRLRLLEGEQPTRVVRP